MGPESLEGSAASRTPGCAVIHVCVRSGESVPALFLGGSGSKPGAWSQLERESPGRLVADGASRPLLWSVGVDRGPGGSTPGERCPGLQDLWEARHLRSEPV